MGAAVLLLALSGCSTDATLEPSLPSSPPALGATTSATVPPAGSVKPKRAAGGAQALVIDVVDGDTITVRADGKERTIRLIGIDTPETVDPFQEVGCFGPQASAFVLRELDGAHVGLTYDVERLDRYGRTLAYVWTDGLFNERLVRLGYATAYPYPPNTKFAARFARAEQQARTDGLGLWKSCASATSEPSNLDTGGTASGGGSGGDCEPAYPTVCLPVGHDLDCAQIPATDFKAKPTDPFFLDGNHDGRACESS